MKRVIMAERPDWRAKAEEFGFVHAQADGRPYWDETAAYLFTMREIEEDLEAATAELVALCGEFAARAVRDQAYLERLGVPYGWWDFIASSWDRGDRSLYGRFDFVYGGQRPPKLLEFNADTPTALYEAAVFQWFWLEDRIMAGVLPAGADQFNSLHDKLIARFKVWPPGHRALHMTAFSEAIEDARTVEYLRDCAALAGHVVKLIDIADIGRDGEGCFVDTDDQPIDLIFKLYPWEWLMKEPFAASIPRARTIWIEPVWKILLSSKAILPELWRLAPGHPNLLEAYHEEDPAAAGLAANHVSKPIFSREGANVRFVRDGAALIKVEGPYQAEKRIAQALAPDVAFDGMRPVIGSWIIDSEPAGIGMREDTGLVTGNFSRFLPHAIVD